MFSARERSPSKNNGFTTSAGGVDALGQELLRSTACGLGAGGKAVEADSTSIFERLKKSTTPISDRTPHAIQYDSLIAHSITLRCRNWNRFGLKEKVECVKKGQPDSRQFKGRLSSRRAQRDDRDDSDDAARDGKRR